MFKGIDISLKEQAYTSIHILRTNFIISSSRGREIDWKTIDQVTTTPRAIRERVRGVISKIGSLSSRPLVGSVGMWQFVKALTRGYEYLMKVTVAPVAKLAWLLLVSEFQTRLLFNDHVDSRAKTKE
ncbi:hypothetical protein VNO77_39322 [Canavalia gladiata]|uniref:Uncharacterized protein n=1 Tax=Canavalia gladiata TaxID=3824 RepID=A0AAN9KAW3_CANGL